MKLIKTSTIPLSLNVLLKGQLKFFSKKFNVIGISSEGEDLIEVEKREGIKTIAVDMERGISPLKDLISLFKLYKIFLKQKPTIVHSITPKAGLLTMLAGKMAGVPIRMHTFTGLIFPTRTGFTQNLLIKMDQLLCLAATNIYPEGNGVKEDLVNYQITSKPLKVLANGNVNGIDLDFFSKEHFSTEQLLDLKEELGIQPNDFVFVFVGRLVGDKGINELVKAFQKLEIRDQKLGISSEPQISSLQSPISNSQSRIPKLLLVGPLETELDPLKSETLKEIETNPNIISVGFQKDVRPYFAIANALVFPSYREGFPNVVMQAGAMELPSIVSDINGCNEIIVEGENGIIIPVKNSDAVLQAMQCLIEDNDYYSKLKGNARPMIQSRYEQSVVWNALLEEYNSLISKLAN
ncbi:MULTISPECIES: glycosyltransferase family 4 protein [unclassified Empedobacter]|uniref:glycosyltransferase family 4 protein n=1 Tax=unclassified Empedobacter TaxID=2643773 RepID=UPI0025C70373|nr:MULTISPECIES: glycosyltransferase family 4 protein [unclassified Empedobacter]